MKFKKIVLILIAIIFSVLILGNMKTYAATTGSFSLNKSKVSIKKGKTTTFSIKLTNCEGIFTIKSSNTKVATVSSSSEWIDLNGNKTITIKAVGKGEATISVIAEKGNVSDDQAEPENVIGTKTIKVTVTDSSSSSNSTSSSGDSTVNKLSTDATLKNLGITPEKYDFSGFKKATTSYSVTVPYEAEKISIYADTNDSKATVTGTGSKALEVGLNTFKIKVTAEDKKTTKTYTLKITRKKEAEVSTDATLKNLGITPTEYDFSGFRKMTTSYDVKVPYEAEKIKVYADTNSDKATIIGTGSKTLDVGLNTFTVKVTAEDKKTTKTYTLKITREEEHLEEDETIENEISVDKLDETEVTGLTNLEIESLELEPAFSNDVYEYKVKASSDLTNLDIKTEKSSDDIIIDIVGNENLQNGENVITILVYNSKKDETTTYQIIANLEENIDLTDVNNSMSGLQRELIAKRAIIIGIIIVIAMLIIVFIVKRNKILSRNEFLENNDKTDRIDLSRDESMFERINENTEVIKKKSKKVKGKRFK